MAVLGVVPGALLIGAVVAALRVRLEFAAEADAAGIFSFFTGGFATFFVRGARGGGLLVVLVGGGSVSIKTVSANDKELDRLMSHKLMKRIDVELVILLYQGEIHVIVLIAIDLVGFIVHPKTPCGAR